MNIAYYHDSKFGNGAAVAEQFKKDMASRGITVSVSHMRDADPKNLPSAELYVFSSPGRFGKPKRDARKFLRNVSLKPQTLYAILTTQGAPKPDPKTGRCLCRPGRGLAADDLTVIPFLHGTFMELAYSF
jgi:hypothetical protein